MKRKPRPYEDTHKMIDGVIYKLCSDCDDWHPMTGEYFYKNKSAIDGFNPYCKSSSIKRQQVRYWKDPILGRQKKKEWRDNNKENHRKMMNEWSKEHKEHLKEYQSNWRKENPEKIKDYNKDRELHKKHEITDIEWFECLDFFNNSCAYCGLSEEDQVKSFGEQFHKEHVIHTGNNYIDNCVPSCTSCNTSKHDKEFNEWYNEKNPNFTQERLNKIIKWMTEECFKVLNLI